MKTVIEVDADLVELVPLYLQHRRDELSRIDALLGAGDFSALWSIAHNLHGSGGGVGFDFLTELGKRMEISAKDSDKAALSAQTVELKDFLDSVEVRFVTTI